MKIAVIGTGGVGGYYGALLVQQGNDVSFVARGDHLEKMRSDGLHVKSVFGDFFVSPIHVTEKPEEIGEVDLVLFCVKTYDTDSVARSIQPIVGTQTTVISLQNGIDAADRIGAIIGKNHMIGGATWISSAVEAPGVIKQVSQFRKISIGEFNGRVTPRLISIYDAMRSTGTAVEIEDNITKILWTKFIFISAASILGALTRLPIGDYRHIPQTRQLIIGVMKNVVAVAQARGVKLDEDVIEKCLAFIDQAAPQIKPSMQLDLENGRKFELESLVGIIGKMGRELGIPTPNADFAYAVLLPINKKAQDLQR